MFFFFCGGRPLHQPTHLVPPTGRLLSSPLRSSASPLLSGDGCVLHSDARITERPSSPKVTAGHRSLRKTAAGEKDMQGRREESNTAVRGEQSLTHVRARAHARPNAETGQVMVSYGNRRSSTIQPSNQSDNQSIFKKEHFATFILEFLPFFKKIIIDS